MDEKVGWGVLGNATIARKCMFKAIAESRNSRLVTLGTRRPSQAAAIGDRFIRLKVVDGYESVLEDPEVTAVYIPLPNHLHHPWTIRALEAGKHVLCEKPLACNAQQGREMAAAAKKAGRILMEAMMFRFHPRNMMIKQMVDQGVLGRVHLVRTAFTFRIDPEILTAGSNVRLQPDAGGGALLDVGCYGVSTARWLLGKKPREVQGLRLVNKAGVDLLFCGAMQFDQQAMAVVEAGFITALQQTFSVVGGKGAIELPHNAFVPWEKPSVFTLRTVDQEDGRRRHVAPADEYQQMVEHFAGAVQGRHHPAVSLQESIENMETLDALNRSARTGRSEVV